jgi:hypothetical protein
VSDETAELKIEEKVPVPDGTALGEAATIAAVPLEVLLEMGFPTMIKPVWRFDLLV